jgi:hypothetical protein
MSEPSYFRNESLGVTGPNHSTCDPAGAERVSPNHELTESIYPFYEEWVTEYSQLSDEAAFNATPEKIDVYNKIFKELGGFTCDDVIFKEINSSPEYLDRQLQRCLRLGQRVVIAVTTRKMNHALGVFPGRKEGTFALRSNMTPCRLRGNVTAATIFDNLTRPTIFSNVSKSAKAKNHPINYANLMIMPAA